MKNVDVQHGGPFFLSSVPFAGTHGGRQRGFSDFIFPHKFLLFEFLITKCIYARIILSYGV